MITYIPIVFCFDGKFANYAAVATYSTFINATTPTKFYWLIPGVDIALVSEIKEKLSDKGLDINIQMVDSSQFKDWKETGHITFAAYIRLLIPETVSEEKVIYLDCDIIVQADLLPMFRTPLGQNCIAGVYDEGGSLTSKIPRAQTDQYLNSGVLLMDLEKMRADNFLSKCKGIYQNFENKITWNDQCIINKYAESRKQILSPKWNYFMRTRDYPSRRTIKLGQQPENVAVIHFLTDIKPWHKTCPPCIADIWWKYADKIQLAGLTRERYTLSIRLKRILGRIRGIVKSIILKFRPIG